MTANKLEITPAVNTMESDVEAVVLLHCVEGLALAIMCQQRSTPKKIAIALLKEAKAQLAQFFKNVGFP